MATINYAAREISVKIVYYGPGLSGKTTNLQIIHRKIPKTSKSDMVSLATETDRTLFFDFLPLDLGKIRGFTTKFQLYTVPGQVYYNATRKLVLRGVDGIVFIADSAADKLDENIESFQNMEENLAEYGYKRESIPIIMQYNKRDLPNAMPIQEINGRVNKYNLPWSEAIANKGKGVFESLKLIGKLVIDQLNQKYASSATKKRPGASTRSMPHVSAPQPTPPRPVQSSPKPPMPSTPPSYPPQQSFTPEPPQPRREQQPPPSQYGSINLEPMVTKPPSSAPKPVPPAPPPGSGQNNLDFEMERYYDQLNQKQAQPRHYTPEPPPPPPSQPAPHNEEPVFEPPVSRSVPPFQSQPPEQPFNSQPPHNQQSAFSSGGYNYPPPQPQSQQMESQPKQSFPHEPAGAEGPMYFTSVNTDKYKRKGKKPVNPRHKQKTSFFKKLFNREE